MWEKEKEALDERKKLAQLQKERAEERQIQELQRLQAAQGGKKVQEKVEWLYAAPSAGAGPQAEELEQYLLGKKTVDKLFKEQDERKMAEMAAASGQAGASSSQAGVAGLTAVGQNANNARDLATKVREDPLLAIKRQEQAAYEAAKRKYIREGKMKSGHIASTGTNAVAVVTSSKRKREKEMEKEEKRRRKEERRRRRDERREGENERSHSDSDDRRQETRHRRARSRDGSPRYATERTKHTRDNDVSPPRRRRSYTGSPSFSDEDRRVDDKKDRSHKGANDNFSRRDDGARSNGRQRSSPRRDRYDDRSYTRIARPDYNIRSSSDRSSNRYPSVATGHMSEEQRAKARESAAARLAAMQKDAADLNSTRADRVARNEAADAEVLAMEEEQRQKSAKGLKGPGPEFMLNEYRKLGETSLGDAIKGKGRNTMIRDRDD